MDFINLLCFCFCFCWGKKYNYEYRSLLNLGAIFPAQLLCVYIGKRTRRRALPSSMKFKFCGDLDCPDWALAAIISITKLSSVKFRQLAQEVARMLCDDTKNVIPSRKICGDAKLNLDDAKTVIAATEFFLSNAVTHKVNAEVFSNELQQLGFPKEHAAALTRVYQSDGQQLTIALGKSGFRVSRLLHTEWMPDVVLSDNQGHSSTSSPGVLMSMRIQGTDHQVKTYSFLMSLNKLRILKHEVADMLHVMDSLNVPKGP